MTHSDWYGTGAGIVWCVVFFGCWIYAISAYGFFLGLGWLPSLFIAAIAAALWPLLAALLVMGIIAFIAIVLLVK